MILDLRGRTVLVCGATDGIGKATATAFAQSGASVVAFARSEERLAALLLELQGSRHEAVVADFDEPIDVRKVIRNRLDRRGVIDVIVNNSGGPPGGPLADADPEAFRIAMNRLLLSGHEIIRECLPGMKERRFGRIINIISTSVRQPLDNLGVSNTIRSATSAWAKTLSREVAEFGVTVNNVLPGATATQRLAAIIENTAKRTGKSVEEVETDMIGEVPMKRFARPEEVAGGVVFLASEQASYITGINLTIDGGRTRSLL
ncbi:MAG: SDR family oxidoreductase [Candidatus Kapaibacterium sp.]